jgi:hypothetical protein
MSDFTPILFEDGSSYTAEEVEWVCLDYLAAAERTIDRKRHRARYQRDLQKGLLQTTPGNTKKVGTQIVLDDDRSKFIREVKNNGDYMWIVSVALSRNQIDPMHATRIKMYSMDYKTGKSLVDKMMEEYVNILSDPDRSYQDMAKAKFIRGELELLSKRVIQSGPPQINVGVAVNTSGNTPAAETKTEIIDVTPVKGLKR